MKIIQVQFTVGKEELTSMSPEAVENAIKEEMIKAVVDAIAPMLDDEGFIDMSPSEENEGDFVIKINMMIGSTSKYIDATAEVTKNLMSLFQNHNVPEEDASKIIRDATKPLIDLVV